MNFLDEHISCPVINIVQICQGVKNIWHAQAASQTGKLANLQVFHKNSAPKIKNHTKNSLLISRATSCDLTAKLCWIIFDTMKSAVTGYWNAWMCNVTSKLVHKGKTCRVILVYRRLNLLPQISLVSFLLSMHPESFYYVHKRLSCDP